MQDEPLLPGQSDVAKIVTRKPSAPALPECEDFYYEGSLLVFTASYHLKRGSCCESNCRHCPYRDTAAAPPF